MQYSRHANQHSSEDTIAITAELPSIIAITSCDIRVWPCTYVVRMLIVCYELYIHTYLTHVTSLRLICPCMYALILICLKI